jgi:hypothetical protein
MLHFPENAMPTQTRWRGLLLCALALCACTTTATIQRRTGPTLQATIDGSDRTALYVTTPAAERYLVQRSDVVDIAHPGKDLMVVGLGAIAAGGLLWALTLQAQNPSGFIGIPRAFAAGGIAIGLPLTVDGAASYLHSRFKARSR